MARTATGTFPGARRSSGCASRGATLEVATGSPIDVGSAARALERIRDEFLAPEAWMVFPDVRPALDELRRDGARLAVVSNWDSRLPRVLEMLGLAPYFDVVGVSHLEGVEKPDPEIFRRVLERLGARAAEALHVGDVSDLDLAGARAAGVAAVLIDRRGAHAPGPDVIQSLAALPSKIR